MKENWSEEVDTHETYHTPPETFTKSATEIASILLDGAHGNTTKALQRLVFYMNRAGDKLSNKTEIEKAKTILENKINS